MEQLVLGIFQEQLAKFIVGFKKEQVNANLLNGKGEIKDVKINCSFINEKLSRITPFFEIEEINVSQLSFNVTNWANLKKAPILVDVEDVLITLVEPLHYLDESERITMKQLSKAQYSELMKDTKPRGSYNLLDRILDNLQLEVRSIKIVFQTRGKFKTRRVGPWTPPYLVMVMRHFKYCSVNEAGNPASPDECWRHNKFEGRQSEQTLVVYKKCSMQLNVQFQDPNNNNPELELPPIIKGAHIDVQLAFYKKFSNAAILSIQMDTVMNRVEVDISPQLIPILAHVMAGMTYCFAKDRAFEDPLVPDRGIESADEKIQVLLEPTVQTSSSHDVDDSDDEMPESLEKVDDADMDKLISEDGGVVAEEGKAASSSDEPPEAIAESSKAEPSSAPVDRSMSPVIILPSGITIHEKISMSLSVQDAKVRGTYSNEGYEYIQLDAQGLVAEFIWPKTTGEKGSYMQMSLANMTMQEMYKGKLRTVVEGGSRQIESSEEAVENTQDPKPLISRDEFFPLFEERCVRPDPLDLRHSFPLQTVGLKTTMSYIENPTDPEKEDIMALTEVGLETLTVVLDAEVWCRVMRFGLNDTGGGFDERWNSGDWSMELTTDMLVHPSASLELVDHVQAIKQTFLDENDFVSSDLINITAKLSAVQLKIPADITADVRSCDIVVGLGELMLVVSSALPRTFLPGKIGSSIAGEGSLEHATIEFPNDPSDICYTLHEREDPLLRHEGTDACRRVSTFRCQLTLKGLKVEILPVIPYFNAQEASELLSPTEFTVLFCFEGEPPENDDSDLIKVVIFSSVQLHRLMINCDFDLVAGATSSILSQVEEFKEALKTMPPSSKSLEEYNSADELSSVPSTLEGRRVLVKHQIQRSRQTGGFSFDSCLQLAEIGVTVWRQNVPLNSPFRASVTGDQTNHSKAPIPLVQLANLRISGIELGAEKNVQQDNHRLILKCSVSGVTFDVCNFDAMYFKYGSNTSASVKEISRDSHEKADSQAFASQTAPFKTNSCMTRIIEIGGTDAREIVLRVEERKSNDRCVSFSGELNTSGTIMLHVDQIETTFLLLIEGLLVPTEIEAPSSWPRTSAPRFTFPAGCIGSFFLSLFPSREADSLESCTSTRLDLKRVVTESNTIDEAMFFILNAKVPNGIDQLLIRLSLGNLDISLPSISTATQNDGQDVAGMSAWLTYSLKRAVFISTFLGTSPEPSNESMLHVFARAGESWKSLLGERQNGFFHSVHVSQAIYSTVVASTSTSSTKVTMLDSFEVGITYAPNGVSLSLGDSTLSINDLSHIRELKLALECFVNRVTLTLLRIKSIIATMVGGAAVPSASLPADDTDRDSSLDKQVAVESFEHYIELTKGYIERASFLFEAHDRNSRAKITRKQAEVDRLRVQVFQKESSRLSALSLVSCQCAGWLRVGGMHKAGERSPTVASMWRFHAILRKSLLFLYARPGQPRPLDVINLHGARLLSLAGGRRKTDVKNGFGIRDRSGCIKFVLAPNGPEFDTWTESLAKCIKQVTPQDMLDEPSFLTSDEVSFSGSEVRSRSASEVRSRTFSSDVDIDGNDFSNGDDAGAKRGSQIRERFSKATAGTRVRLGSAVLAAKEKVSNMKAVDSYGSFDGMNAAAESVVFSEEHPATQDAKPVENVSELASESQSVESWEEPYTKTETTDQNITSMESSSTAGGIRFANMRSNAKNRFGSAMQGAREKALQVAEERRRRKQEENLSGERVGLRQRLETAAANVKAKIDQGEVQKSQEEDADAQKPTFIVDGADTGDDIAAKSSNEDEVEEAGVPMDSNVDTAATRLRGKVSQIGAAVKNARQVERGSERVRGQEDDLVRASRFSIMRRRPEDSPFPTESDLTKLKSVRVNGDLGLADNEVDAVEEIDQQLAVIKGNWVVHVQSQLVKGQRPTTGDVNQETGDVAATNITSDKATDVPSDPQIMDSVEDSNKFVFSIRVFSQDLKSKGKKMKITTITRSYMDVVGLYVGVAELVAQIASSPIKSMPPANRDPSEDMPEELASTLGIAPLDIVKLTGELLGGLLSASDEFQSIPAYHEYQCEVLTEFLNSMLNCSMPSRACMYLLEFLEMTGASTIPVSDDTNESRGDTKKPERDEDLADHASEIVSLTIASISQLLRAQANGILAQTLASPQSPKAAAPAKIVKTAPMVSQPFMDPLLPSSISNGLRGAMHEALIKAMTERDEAQAQLIGSSVAHVHQIENERKKRELLGEKLRAAEEAKQQQGGGLFGERKDPKAAELHKYQEELIVSSDNEITGLHKQLAEEVSAKTAANLEIDRLKESRRIEREQDALEKKALEEELRKARELLAAVENSKKQDTSRNDGNED